MQPSVRDGALCLRFPDGAVVEGDVELGERIETTFFGRPVAARLVVGPWSAALSELAGTPVRLARTEREGDGYDRGPDASASLVSTGSLEALAAAAGEEGVIDGRRFRMTIGVDAAEPHVEDSWIGRRVRVGGAVVVPRDRVGRCAVTTRDPDTGERTLDTLGAIAAYRADVQSVEPLPFGVWCSIASPGRVAVGDPVEVVGP